MSSFQPFSASMRDPRSQAGLVEEMQRQLDQERSERVASVQGLAEKLTQQQALLTDINESQVGNTVLKAAAHEKKEMLSAITQIHNDVEALRVMIFTLQNNRESTSKKLGMVESDMVNLASRCEQKQMQQEQAQRKILEELQELQALRTREAVEAPGTTRKLALLEADVATLQSRCEQQQRQQEQLQWTLSEELQLLRQQQPKTREVEPLGTGKKLAALESDIASLQSLHELHQKQQEQSHRMLVDEMQQLRQQSPKTMEVDTYGISKKLATLESDIASFQSLHQLEQKQQDQSHRMLMEEVQQLRQHLPKTRDVELSGTSSKLATLESDLASLLSRQEHQQRQQEQSHRMLAEELQQFRQQTPKMKEVELPGTTKKLMAIESDVASVQSRHDQYQRHQEELHGLLKDELRQLREQLPKRSDAELKSSLLEALTVEAEKLRREAATMWQAHASALEQFEGKEQRLEGLCQQFSNELQDLRGRVSRELSGMDERDARALLYRKVDNLENQVTVLSAASLKRSDEESQLVQREVWKHLDAERMSREKGFMDQREAHGLLSRKVDNLEMQLADPQLVQREVKKHLDAERMARELGLMDCRDAQRELEKRMDAERAAHEQGLLDYRESHGLLSRKVDKLETLFTDPELVKRELEQRVEKRLDAERILRENGVMDQRDAHGLLSRKVDNLEKLLADPQLIQRELDKRLDAERRLREKGLMDHHDAHGLLSRKVETLEAQLADPQLVQREVKKHLDAERVAREKALMDHRDAHGLLSRKVETLEAQLADPQLVKKHLDAERVAREKGLMDHRDAHGLLSRKVETLEAQLADPQLVQREVKKHLDAERVAREQALMDHRDAHGLLSRKVEALEAQLADPQLVKKHLDAERMAREKGLMDHRDAHGLLSRKVEALEAQLADPQLVKKHLDAERTAREKGLMDHRDAHGLLSRKVEALEAQLADPQLVKKLLDAERMAREKGLMDQRDAQWQLSQKVDSLQKLLADPQLVQRELEKRLDAERALREKGLMDQHDSHGLLSRKVEALEAQLADPQLVRRHLDAERTAREQGFRDQRDAHCLLSTKVDNLQKLLADQQFAKRLDEEQAAREQSIADQRNAHGQLSQKVDGLQKLLDDPQLAQRLDAERTAREKGLMDQRDAHGLLSRKVEALEAQLADPQLVKKHLDAERTAREKGLMDQRDAHWQLSQKVDSLRKLLADPQLAQRELEKRLDAERALREKGLLDQRDAHGQLSQKVDNLQKLSVDPQLAQRELEKRLDAERALREKGLKDQTDAHSILSRKVDNFEAQLADPKLVQAEIKKHVDAERAVREKGHMDQRDAHGLLSQKVDNLQKLLADQQLAQLEHEKCLNDERTLREKCLMDHRDAQGLLSRKVDNVEAQLADPKLLERQIKQHLDAERLLREQSLRDHREAHGMLSRKVDILETQLTDPQLVKMEVQRLLDSERAAREQGLTDEREQRGFLCRKVDNIEKQMSEQIKEDPQAVQREVQRLLDSERASRENGDRDERDARSLLSRKVDSLQAQLSALHESVAKRGEEGFDLAQREAKRLLDAERVSREQADMDERDSRAQLSRKVDNLEHQLNILTGSIQRSDDEVHVKRLLEAERAMREKDSMNDREHRTLLSQKVDNLESQLMRHAETQDAMHKFKTATESELSTARGLHLSLADEVRELHTQRGSLQPSLELQRQIDELKSSSWAQQPDIAALLQRRQDEMQVSLRSHSKMISEAQGEVAACKDHGNRINSALAMIRKLQADLETEASRRCQAIAEVNKNIERENEDARKLVETVSFQKSNWTRPSKGYPYAGWPPRENSFNEENQALETGELAVRDEHPDSGSQQTMETIHTLFNQTADRSSEAVKSYHDLQHRVNLQIEELTSAVRKEEDARASSVSEVRQLVLSSMDEERRERVRNDEDLKQQIDNMERVRAGAVQPVRPLPVDTRTCVVEPEVRTYTEEPKIRTYIDEPVYPPQRREESLSMEERIGVEQEEASQGTYAQDNSTLETPKRSWFSSWTNRT